jgi:hypothetical protein
VLLAETLKHFFPKMVEIHNYSGANSLAQVHPSVHSQLPSPHFPQHRKTTTGIHSTVSALSHDHITEFHTEKVLKKLDIMITPEDIENIVQGVPGYIERLLRDVQMKVTVAQICCFY